MIFIIFAPFQIQGVHNSLKTTQNITVYIFRLGFLYNVDIMIYISILYGISISYIQNETPNIRGSFDVNTKKVLFGNI